MGEYKAGEAPNYQLVRKLSWNHWDMLMRGLYSALNHACPHTGRSRWPQQIIGIARGGVIAASQLSHLLGVPYAGTIHTHTIKGELGDKKVIDARQMSDQEVINTLFVDDIVDTGYTIEMLLKVYPQAKFVAPTGKVKGCNLVGKSLYVMPTLIVDDEVWLEFPWESTHPYRD